MKEKQKESFSSSVKSFLSAKCFEELGVGEMARVKWKECCAGAFLRSVFLHLCHREGDEEILSSDRESLLEVVAFLLIRRFDVEAKPLPRERGNRKGAILALPLGTKERILRETVDVLDPRCDRCRILYIRAAFLSRGTILDPAKGYHAAFLVPGEREAKELASFLEFYGIEPRFSQSEKGILLYLKESGKIEDLLAIMGAQRFSLDLMNERIDKSIRGNINRRLNFDGANMKKTVDGAQSVISAIHYLSAEEILPTLPEALQKAAMLRLSYPEVSLAELVERSEEEITKSGLNHRLRKLVQLAEKMKNKEEETL